MAQTLFVDEEISARYLLDAIVTLVDAKHAMAQHREHHEAKEQVGFADRILLSKTDLVATEELRVLEQRLKRMNARAPIKAAHFGQTPIGQLDIRGFDLNAILQIEPDFLIDVTHEHDDDGIRGRVDHDLLESQRKACARHPGDSGQILQIPWTCRAFMEGEQAVAKRLSARPASMPPWVSPSSMQRRSSRIISTRATGPGPPDARMSRRRLRRTSMSAAHRYRATQGWAPSRRRQ